MANKIVPKDKLVNFVGTKVESTGWFEVTQSRVNTFAECTGDNQFIHTDVEKAKATHLGGTIAHGLLTLSLALYLRDNFPIPEHLSYCLNYGYDKVRFISPVRTGKRVRMHGEILDVHWKDEHTCKLKVGVIVEIEGEEKPALYAEGILYYETEGALTRSSDMREPLSSGQ